MSDLDQFFAKRILKDHYTEARGRFLATLMHVSRQGHLCWTTDEKPDLPPSIVQEGGSATAPVIKQQDRYYLQKNWMYETYILEQVHRLRAQSPPPFTDFHQELDSSPLLPSQKAAVLHAAQNSFSLICGGPGTGKTYTAGYLARFLKLKKIAIAAPTGKAASHLQSILGIPAEATTLHRLLRLSPGESRLFSKRKIDADLVLVDEASMIDVPLLAQLLESIGNETRLVLMGDPDQLPPVEAGSLFAEMAALFGSPLQKTMRTDDAGLQALAEGINRGEYSGSHRINWTFDSSLYEKIFAAVRPFASWEEPDPQTALQELNRFRVLGALRQGPFGTEALNRTVIQEMSRRIQPGQWWSVPIMITSNEPRQELYNGSCGVLIGKSRGGINFREGVAYFPEKVPFKLLPPFEAAFCLSIHKSQGSEFERILALFPPGSENFGRESFYTAVTRAKKQVEIVAEEEILRAMLAQRSRRNSGFTARF